MNKIRIFEFYVWPFRKTGDLPLYGRYRMRDGTLFVATHDNERQGITIAAYDIGDKFKSGIKVRQER